MRKYRTQSWYWTDFVLAALFLLGLDITAQPLFDSKWWVVMAAGALCLMNLKRRLILGRMGHRALLIMIAMLVLAVVLAGWNWPFDHHDARLYPVTVWLANLAFWSFPIRLVTLWVLDPFFITKSKSYNHTFIHRI